MLVVGGEADRQSRGELPGSHRCGVQDGVGSGCGPHPRCWPRSNPPSCAWLQLCRVAAATHRTDSLARPTPCSRCGPPRCLRPGRRRVSRVLKVCISICLGTFRGNREEEEEEILLAWRARRVENSPTYIRRVTLKTLETRSHGDGNFSPYLLCETLKTLETPLFTARPPDVTRWG